MLPQIEVLWNALYLIAGYGGNITLLAVIDILYGIPKKSIRLDGGGKPVSIDLGVWRSLVAHVVRDDGVGGSNPLTPTNLQNLDFHKDCNEAKELAAVFIVARKMLS